MVTNVINRVNVISIRCNRGHKFRDENQILFGPQTSINHAHTHYLFNEDASQSVKKPWEDSEE